VHALTLPQARPTVHPLVDHRKTLNVESTGLAEALAAEKPIAKSSVPATKTCAHALAGIDASVAPVMRFDVTVSASS